jgi:hypothetical protein
MSGAGRKTRRWALGLSLLVATLAAVVWLSWPRERLLLEMAHAVVAIDAGLDKQGDPKEQVYWLTSKRLLIITTEEDGSGTAKWTGHAEISESGTHVRTRLVGLTRLLNERSTTRLGKPFGFQLSPSGSRLCWWDGRMRNMGNVQHVDCRVAVATLDGAMLREWFMEQGSPCFWMDDKRFVDMKWNRQYKLSQLRIHEMLNPHGDRTVEPSSTEARRIFARCSRHNPLDSAIYTVDDDHTQIMRERVDARNGQLVIRRDTVTLPKNTLMVGQAGASHQSTEALLLQHSETPLVFVWMHRLTHSVSIKPVVEEGLWVNLAGTQQMHEIGHIPVRPGKNNTIEGDQIDQLQWLPDGKQISFTYRGMLYVTPTTASP